MAPAAPAARARFAADGALRPLRPLRGGRAALVVCVVALTCACSGPNPEPGATPATRSPAPASSAASASPTDTTGPTAVAGSPTLSTELASPPSTDPPATSAGELTGSDLPTAAQLGPGWTARIEDGGVEDGPGNGTPYQRREPEQIVALVVPLGCEQRSATTTPEVVLQATYANDSDFAVALLMKFDTAAQAASFAESRTADLLACAEQPDDSVSGASAPVTRVRTLDGVTRSRYRLADSPQLRWRSAQWTSGDRVLILDASAPVSLTDWPTG